MNVIRGIICALYSDAKYVECNNGFQVENWVLKSEVRLCQWSSCWCEMWHLLNLGWVGLGMKLIVGYYELKQHVSQLKYSGRLNSDNGCYHSVQNIQERNRNRGCWSWGGGMWKLHNLVLFAKYN
jgi:hypothetical protein